MVIIEVVERFQKIRDCLLVLDKKVQKMSEYLAEFDIHHSVFSHVPCYIRYLLLLASLVATQSLTHLIDSTILDFRVRIVGV